MRYLFLEEDFPKALMLAEELDRRYERNFRFKVLSGVSSIRMGLEGEYRRILGNLSERGMRSSSLQTSLRWKRRALYLESIYHLYGGSFDEAREKIGSILRYQDPLDDPMMIAWPLVKMGISYDLEGKREDAIKYYNRVTKMKNGSGVVSAG